MNHSWSSYVFVLSCCMYFKRHLGEHRVYCIVSSNQTRITRLFKFLIHVGFGIDMNFISIGEASNNDFTQKLRSFRKERAFVFAMHDISLSKLVSFYPVFEPAWRNINYQPLMLDGQEIHYNFFPQNLLRITNGVAVDINIIRQQNGKLHISPPLYYERNNSENLIAGLVRNSQEVIFHSPHIYNWYFKGYDYKMKKPLDR